MYDVVVFICAAVDLNFDWFLEFGFSFFFDVVVSVVVVIVGKVMVVFLIAVTVFAIG